MKTFTRLTRREYPLAVRLVVTLAAGMVFALLIPYLLFGYAPRLDALWSFQRISLGTVGYIVGGLIVLSGFLFALWPISDQLFAARGTPIPVVATKVLLVRGPFRLCRNPMGFGAIMAYLGVAILTGSISALLCVLIFAGLFVTYVKLFEEHELEARFGEAYTAYKASTPFLIPDFTRLKKPKKHDN